MEWALKRTLLPLMRQSVGFVRLFGHVSLQLLISVPILSYESRSICQIQMRTMI